MKSLSSRHQHNIFCRSTLWREETDRSSLATRHWINITVVMYDIYCRGQRQGKTTELFDQNSKSAAFLKHVYIPNKPTTFSTTCCSQSWLIAGNPSACSESVCQPIVFTTASQMGEWLRRNSNSLEGCKPLLLFLPCQPACLPQPLSSPKWSPCRKQAHQCHFANCLHVFMSAVRGRKRQLATACLSASTGTLPCPSKNRGPRVTTLGEHERLKKGAGWQCNLAVDEGSGGEPGRGLRNPHQVAGFFSWISMLAQVCFCVRAYGSLNVH